MYPGILWIFFHPFGLTSPVFGAKLNPVLIMQHDDENQYTPIRFPRELPVGARQ
jgi:hypothetical protein